MNQRDILEEDKIALGDFCLAPFSEEGRNPEYYRARIRNLTPGHAWVYFVDYGNSLRIPKEDLLSFNDAHRDQNLHQQECLVLYLCKLTRVHNFSSLATIFYRPLNVVSPGSNPLYCTAPSGPKLGLKSLTPSSAVTSII